MKKLLVVDGNSILNRAFYGIRLLSTKDGIYTNAVYGTVNILSKQIEMLKPDYAAIAFDLKAPTFRHKMYDQYKAGRKKMPDELFMQLPIAKECAEILGFTVLEKEGYEADDILGTLAKKANENGCEAYILTGDRDSLQLIGDSTTVLLATNADTLRFDRNAFREKYGVEPEQFVDVKALMGDSSDNIPGVAGIGEKTALKLISDYHSLDDLYASLPDSTLTPTTNKKLLDGKDSAEMSRKLAAICCDVPLELSEESLRYRGIDRSKAYSMFTKLEFSGFIKKFGLTSSDKTVDVQKADREDDVAENKSVSPAKEVKVLTAEQFVLLPTDLTYSVSAKENFIETFNGREIYEYCGDLAGVSSFFSPGRKIVCYDAKSLYEFLDTAGIKFRNCFHDIMLGAYVLNPSENSFDFERLALTYLGQTLDGEYSPSQIIYGIYKIIDEKIQETSQSSLMYDIEMPLSAVLADMEEYGFKIDREGMRKFGGELEDVASELCERIYFLAGGEFNINSPKQLSEVLFERLCLPAGKKTKTGYSTNAEVLEKLRPYHPIIDDILEYRQVTKLKSTYADGLVKVADEAGRVHTTFKQTGTATGRLSSAEPNLQNIPIRTTLGRQMRKYFIPESSDYVLIDADYSQIELRLLACISEDSSMINAFVRGVDIHTTTASSVFGVPIEMVSEELRKRAKAVNFGIVYGIGEFSLAADVGTSVAEAKKYIRNYLANYPGVDAYLKEIVRDAYRDGYVTTLFGRRRYIPELSGQNKIIKKFGERVAMNSPIQGTAADIIKIAMINVDKRLKEAGIDARLILQVHDELLIEANRNCADKALEILKCEMENAVSLAVPLTVDTSIGDNWFDN